MEMLLRQRNEQPWREVAEEGWNQAMKMSRDVRTIQFWLWWALRWSSIVLRGKEVTREQEDGRKQISEWDTDNWTGCKQEAGGCCHLGK